MDITKFVHNVSTKISMQGDVIFNQGDQCDGKMYFIFAGEVSIIKTKDGVEREILRMMAGQCFGELALVSSVPRAATVKVISRTAKFGVIDEKIFYTLAKNSPEFLFMLLKATIARMTELDRELHGC